MHDGACSLERGSMRPPHKNFWPDTVGAASGQIRPEGAEDVPTTSLAYRRILRRCVSLPLRAKSKKKAGNEMPQVTDYYGISGPVPFMNIDVSADNRLYLDPRAIRLRSGTSSFAAEAVHCADTFLKEVTGSIITGSAASMRRGEKLLQRFVEPWETRLGMSEEGFHGRGGAAVVGTWIWNTLNGDVRALVRIGVLRQLEDLPLFVDGVDKDITSDISTRIMFRALARFTESMVVKYPEFTAGGHVVQKVTRQVWNPFDLEWAYEEFTLPVADGKPLLLIPRGWARTNLLMSAGRFYGTTVLTFAQLKEAVRLADGSILTTPKDRLRGRPDLLPGRGTIIRVTKQALDNEEDLIAAFKAFVDSKADLDDSDNATAA